MKICTLCKETFPLAGFNKNATRKDGLQTMCRECNRARSRRYYAENHDLHRENVARRNKKVRSDMRVHILEYLQTHPCIDCGNSDIRVLEFDHRENKVENVSKLVMNFSSKEKVFAEIAKCDVRCRNCHIIKTYERQGNVWRMQAWLEMQTKVYIEQE